MKTSVKKIGRLSVQLLFAVGMLAPAVMAQEVVLSESALNELFGAGAAQEIEGVLVPLGVLPVKASELVSQIGSMPPGSLPTLQIALDRRIEQADSAALPKEQLQLTLSHFPRGLFGDTSRELMGSITLLALHPTNALKLVNPVEWPSLASGIYQSTIVGAGEALRHGEMRQLGKSTGQTVLVVLSFHGVGSAAGTAMRSSAQLVRNLADSPALQSQLSYVLGGEATIALARPVARVAVVGDLAGAGGLVAAPGYDFNQPILASGSPAEASASSSRVFNIGRGLAEGSQQTSSIELFKAGSARVADELDHVVVDAIRSQLDPSAAQTLLKRGATVERQFNGTSVRGEIVAIEGGKVQPPAGRILGSAPVIETHTFRAAIEVRQVFVEAAIPPKGQGFLGAVCRTWLQARRGLGLPIGLWTDVPPYTVVETIARSRTNPGPLFFK